MHPLMTNLTNVPIEELYVKYAELQKRLNQVARIGPIQLVPQIQMIMDDYQREIGERGRRQMEELAERAAKGTKDGKGYSGVIDIV